MTEVTVDFADDRFDIRYDREGTSPEALLKLVDDLGYKGRVVILKMTSPDLGLLGDGFPIENVPEILVKPFALAFTRQWPVLMDFGSPGCVTCRKMDAVTYPHPDVEAELETWIRLRIDVTEHPEVAGLFGVNAMPAALALRADGTVLGRKMNFVQPAEFLEWLREMRALD